MISSPLCRSLYRSLSLSSQRLFSKYTFEREIPSTAERKKMNLFQAVNDAMDIVLAKDKT
jgi:hypothetical protein